MVPILAGLALAATLAMVVITPQMSRLYERRSLVEVMEQKSEALPALGLALSQRRVNQAGNGSAASTDGFDSRDYELETFLAQLNDLADEHQVVVFSTDLVLLRGRLFPSLLLMHLWLALRILLLAIHY